MPITAKLDEFGKPAWIALIVSGSWPGGRWAWPSSPSQYGAEEWDADITAPTAHDRWQHKMERMQRKMDWMGRA